MLQARRQRAQNEGVICLFFLFLHLPLYVPLLFLPLDFVSCPVGGVRRLCVCLFHGWGANGNVLCGGEVVKKSTEEKSRKAACCFCCSRNKLRKFFCCVSFCVCDHCFKYVYISLRSVGGGGMAICAAGYFISCPAAHDLPCLPVRGRRTLSVCPSHVSHTPYYHTTRQP